MIQRDIVRPRTPRASDAPTVVNPASDAAIAAELDVIVGRSQRGSPLRRLGGAVARWLDQLVPPASVQTDLEPPPQIRFPFF